MERAISKYQNSIDAITGDICPAERAVSKGSNVRQQCDGETFNCRSLSEKRGKAISHVDVTTCPST